MLTLLLILAIVAVVAFLVFSRTSIFHRGPVSGRWGRRL
jgi:hypothetical protein